MGFNIDQFTSQLSGKGVSRASLFEARIFFPNTLIIGGRFAGGLDPELTYRADSTSIPGRSTQTIDDARDTTGPMRKLGYTPIYSPIDITFICDEGLQIKEKMESWMDIITGNHRVAPNGELNDTKVFNPGYYNDYIGTIQILKLNERGTIVTTTELIEAYPLNIALMNLSVANKRLDFEIARLKNCGELMKAGIIFKPGTEYAKVCADVMLINPAGVVANHTHEIPVKPPISRDASVLKEISIGNTKK